MIEFFHALLEPKALIMTLGALGVIAIIFVETGLFFGFFLPGDSLLFTAGFLASQGYVSLPLLLVGTFVAAVVGDSVGYAFGKKVGPALFSREDSVVFNKQHIVRAQNFYEKHGKKTIILARFMPIIRTFAPIVAGMGNMRYRTFITFNIIGAFVWTWGMLWLGYGLGALIPNPDRYIIPVVIVIVLTSAAPALKEIFKEARKRMKAE
ncbi:MAG: VTT domain-containing protein [Patescibacteria group bacterium]